MFKYLIDRKGNICVRTQGPLAAGFGQVVVSSPTKFSVAEWKFDLTSRTFQRVPASILAQRKLKAKKEAARREERLLLLARDLHASGLGELLARALEFSGAEIRQALTATRAEGPTS